jgi:hypothetical protein
VLSLKSRSLSFTRASLQTNLPLLHHTPVQQVHHPQSTQSIYNLNSKHSTMSVAPFLYGIEYRPDGPQRSLCKSDMSRRQPRDHRSGRSHRSRGSSSYDAEQQYEDDGYYAMQQQDDDEQYYDPSYAAGQYVDYPSQSGESSTSYNAAQSSSGQSH